MCVRDAAAFFEARGGARRQTGIVCHPTLVPPRVRAYTYIKESSFAKQSSSGADKETRSPPARAADAVARDQAQLRAVLEEHRAGRLRGVDADAICVRAQAWERAGCQRGARGAGGGMSERRSGFGSTSFWRACRCARHSLVRRRQHESAALHSCPPRAFAFASKLRTVGNDGARLRGHLELCVWANVCELRGGGERTVKGGRGAVRLGDHNTSTNAPPSLLSTTEAEDRAHLLRRKLEHRRERRLLGDAEAVGVVVVGLKTVAATAFSVVSNETARPRRSRGVIALVLCSAAAIPPSLSLRRCCCRCGCAANARRPLLNPNRRPPLPSLHLSFSQWLALTRGTAASGPTSA